MKKILFVCTGNTCRSPMAEYLLRSMTDKAEISSAGIQTADGLPASENAVRVMADIGIDLSRFRSRRLTGEMLDGADIIFAIGTRNYLYLRSLGYSPRLIEAEDPYGGTVETYEKCRDRLIKATEEIIGEL